MLRDRLHRIYPLAVFSFLIGFHSRAESVTFTPLGNFSALGGQYFTGASKSSGINIDGSFVPVIGITSKLYILPIYVSSYHQTQSVYNFLGQNTLIQGQLDQTGVLRADWAANSRWRLKPRVGLAKEWSKQSTDESTWNGLFNYTRKFGGLSAERALPNGSLEIGYEYGQVEYPHYQSLDADPRLTTTGITAVTGATVLNFHSHSTSLDYHWITDSKNASFDANATWVRENFIDQKVITSDSDGFQAVIDKKRTDDIYLLTLRESIRPSSRWLVNFGETFQYYQSNQNSYDATQAFANPFTYRYYNYADAQWSPTVTWFWNDARWDLSLGGTIGIRQYMYRKAQDGQGNYLGKRIHSLNRGGNLMLRYRIYKGLRVVLTGNILTYSSNTRYEVNYPYNYTTSSYLGGLSWEF